jgi:DNA-binding transcriptional MerR regulator
VRVYHDRALLPEPSRDSSGYRRYGAEHAIQLAKIKTLVDAGVPLARIKELLGADPERFAAAIDEIDASLRKRADEIRRTRRRISHLRGGDRLFVSEEVAGYLDVLREIGVSERGVLLERDLWVLLSSAAPDQAAAWIADKLDAIADPEFRALNLAYDVAFGWSPDDPRLPALAERTRRWLAGRDGGAEAAVPDDDSMARLAAATAGASSPALLRIAELVKGHRDA